MPDNNLYFNVTRRAYIRVSGKLYSKHIAEKRNWRMPCSWGTQGISGVVRFSEYKSSPPCLLSSTGTFSRPRKKESSETDCTDGRSKDIAASTPLRIELWRRHLNIDETRCDEAVVYARFPNESSARIYFRACDRPAFFSLAHMFTFPFP